MFHANLILEWSRNQSAHSLDCTAMSVSPSHLVDDVEDGANEEGDDGEEDPDDEAGVGGAVVGLRGLGLDWPVENCGARLLRPRLPSSLRGEKAGLCHHRGLGVFLSRLFFSQEITFN